MGWDEVERVGVSAETTPLEATLEAAGAALMRLEPRDNWLMWIDLATPLPPWNVPDEFQEPYFADEPLEGTVPTDPGKPALIAFTSGTTSNPKGVVHSHQTLGFETRQLLANYPAERGRQLTATPVGHFIGMLGAFLIPVLEGASIDLCDVWDPGNVLKLIESDGLSIGGGPPYFVTSLLDHPDCTPEHMSHFTTVGLGGSTVPAAVTRRPADMGMFVFRSYGSSEHPSITGSAPTAPEDKRLYTDGNARPGVEIRLGPDGEIFSRGPDLCLGYTDADLTAKVFDEDGWYRKYRVIFVDGVPYPYHLAISRSWIVHYRTSAMSEATWMRDEERRFLDDPHSVFPSMAMWPMPTRSATARSHARQQL